ncbi:MAG: TatD family hydrolase [Pseudomarimonas sp.]
MNLFDSHCHLDVDEFAVDRDAVVARARATGVTRQLIPAIDFASWPGIRALCAAESGLLPAYGLHPVFVAKHTQSHLDALGEWLQQNRPAAIGECGLDFFVEGLDADAQRLCFQRHLELANEFDLPLVIHARRSVDEVIQRIRRIGGLRGVIHSFSGSIEQAEQLWKMGFFLGIGGPLTYSRALRLRRLVASMPIEFLLLETDSPDQPDAQWRGQRNEPHRLVEIAQCVAELRGVSLQSIADQTWANANRLFAL